MIMNEIISVAIQHKQALSGVFIIVFMTGLYSLGKTHGKVEHEKECSSEIIQIRKLQTDKEDLQKKLSSCETRREGDSTLLCFDDCDKRIQTALSHAKSWACED